MLYEGMFLLDNRQANRDMDGSLEVLKGFITKHGGEVIRCEKWGERKLAYEIKGRRRGTYVLIYFQAVGKAANGIYRECELSELVLRALVLHIEAVPPEGQTPPSFEFGEETPDDRGGRWSRGRGRPRSDSRPAGDAGDTGGADAPDTEAAEAPKA